MVGSFSRLGHAARFRLDSWWEPPRQAGRVYLVTGASSGISRAVARRLGCLGGEVWVVGRDEVRTKAGADAVGAAGGQAEVAVVDVADPDALRGAVLNWGPSLTVPI